MFCSKCGAELADGAKKCDKCGAPIRARSKSAAAGKRREIAFDEAPRDLIDIQNDGGQTKDSSFAEKEAETGQDSSFAEKEAETRLYYGAVTPFEKTRRWIAEVRHSLEESREEKLMRRHMERAAKHYEELGVPKTPILKTNAPSKKDTADPILWKKSVGPAGIDKSENTDAVEAQIVREREEKVRAEYEMKEHRFGRHPEETEADSAAFPEKKYISEKEIRALMAEKTSGKTVAGKAAGADAMQKSGVTRAAGENLSEQKDAEEEADIRKSAGENVSEYKAAGEEADIRKAADEEANIRKAADEKIDAQKAAGADAQQESDASKDGEENISEYEAIALATKKISEASESAMRAAIADQKDAEERTRSLRSDTQDQKDAEERARALLEEAERREAVALQEKRAREERARALSQRVISEEEKQVREARRIRRYYEEEPDEIELFLNKFGLSKEAGVRLATLFIVVILTIIYVIGRGKAPAPSGSPTAGEGITGEQFTVSPSNESTDGDSSFDVSDLPAGGGDFDNTDPNTDVQQEGPDTPEPTSEEP